MADATELYSLGWKPNYQDLNAMDIWSGANHKVVMLWLRMKQSQSDQSAKNKKMVPFGTIGEDLEEDGD